MLKQLLLEILVHYTLTINFSSVSFPTLVVLWWKEDLWSSEASKYWHQTTKVIPCQWRLNVEVLKMIKHDSLPRDLRIVVMQIVSRTPEMNTKIRQYFMADSHRYMMSWVNHAERNLRVVYCRNLESDHMNFWLVKIPEVDGEYDACK